jgi:demethylmenaquinone methyltransferase/2-methoxy-6-polyprenyl-1,4-benzoquinol methylase
VTDKTSASAEIQEYYRVRAASGKYATSPDFNLREVEIDYLARWMKDGQRVLDVGCGTGYTVLRHAAMFDSAFSGIDFVPEMIEQARLLAAEFQTKKNVEFRVGDATSLDEPEGSFDVVVSERCLLNLPTRNDQWRAIGEIARVLRPGGRFLSLDFDRPARWIVRAPFLAYLTAVGSMLGFVLHRDPDTYRYIPESIRLYPGARLVAERMESRGFVRARHVRVFGGLMAIHVATRREGGVE